MTKASEVGDWIFKSGYNLPYPPCLMKLSYPVSIDTWPCTNLFLPSDLLTTKWALGYFPYIPVYSEFSDFNHNKLSLLYCRIVIPIAVAVLSMGVMTVSITKFEGLRCCLQKTAHSFCLPQTLGYFTLLHVTINTNIVCLWTWVVLYIFRWRNCSLVVSVCNVTSQTKGIVGGNCINSFIWSDHLSRCVHLLLVLLVLAENGLIPIFIVGPWYTYILVVGNLLATFRLGFSFWNSEWYITKNTM